MKRLRILALLLSTLLLSTSCGPDSSSETASDSAATYIENKGSDTIVNLALAWAERYQAEHPDIRISVTGGGSGTGIASLINGTVDLANASRKIKEEEAKKLYELVGGRILDLKNVADKSLAGQSFRGRN